MSISQSIKVNSGDRLLQYDIECSIFLQKKQTGTVSSFYKSVAAPFVWVAQQSSRAVYAREFQQKEPALIEQTVESVFRRCKGLSTSSNPLDDKLDVCEILQGMKKVEYLAKLHELKASSLPFSNDFKRLEADLFASVSGLSFDEWQKMKTDTQEDPFARKFLEQFQESEILQILGSGEDSSVVQEFSFLCDACGCRPRAMSFAGVLLNGFLLHADKVSLLRSLFVEGTIYLRSSSTVTACKVAASLIKKEMSLAERVVLLSFIQEIIENKGGDAFSNKITCMESIYNYVSMRLEKAYTDFELLRQPEFFDSVQSLLRNKYIPGPSSRHRFFELTKEDSLFYTLSRLKCESSHSSRAKFISILERLQGFDLENSHLNKRFVLDMCALLRGVSGEKARLEVLAALKESNPMVTAKVCEVAAFLITKQMLPSDRQIILSLLDLILKEKGEGAFPKGKTFALSIYDYLAEKIQEASTDRTSLREIAPYVNFLIESDMVPKPSPKHCFFELTNKESLFHELCEFERIYGAKVFDSLTSELKELNKENISQVSFLMSGVFDESYQCAIAEDIRKIDRKDIALVCKVANFLKIVTMPFQERRVLYSVIAWIIKEKGEGAFSEGVNPVLVIYDHLSEKLIGARGQENEYSLIGSVITIELLMQNKKLCKLPVEHPLMDASGVFHSLSSVKKTYYENSKEVCDRLFSLFEDFEEELTPAIISKLCSLIQDAPNQESQLFILKDLIVMME